MRLDFLAPALLVLTLLGPGQAMLARADAASASGLKPDVRLLIDISGSMKQSDPDRLRAPAVDLIVRLLPDGSRAGIWIFGEEVEALVPHGVVDAAWRELAQQAVAAIDNSGQRTNIPAALEAATYDLGGIDPNYRVSIVLLTDGKVDISTSPMANAAAASKLLDKVAPELGQTGIPVHTIALSDEADWAFLRSLAIATEGIAEKAETADQLSAIYLQSLEMVAPTPTVPVVGRRFAIDDSVEEFTLLVFFEGERAPVGLVSPSGERIEEDAAAAQWFSNEQFAIATVSAPEAGEWELRAPETARTRLTVMSDLELAVDPLPSSLPAGRVSELGVALREGGAVITDPEVLALFDLQLAISGPGGFSLERPIDGPVPANGEFRVSVAPFDEPGRYEVTVRLQGETLQRELRMPLEVIATAATTSTISTRGEEQPPEDLRRPVYGLALAVLVLAVLIYFVLRRRKKRRLEVWERRNRGAEGAESGDVMAGVSADAGDREPHR